MLKPFFRQLNFAMQLLRLWVNEQRCQDDQHIVTGELRIIMLNWGSYSLRALSTQKITTFVGEKLKQASWWVSINVLTHCAVNIGLLNLLLHYGNTKLSVCLMTT